MKSSVSVLLLFAVAPGLAAQAPAPAGADAVASAAATITASDVARRVRIIADDSMGGRDTPSRGLDLTARYVADQFQSFGLKPGGDNGTWFQRYPLQMRRIDLAASSIGIEGDRGAQLSFRKDARLMGAVGTEGRVSGPVLLLAGDLSKVQVSAKDVEGRVVVLPLDYSEGGRQARGQYNRALAVLRESGATPLGVLAVSNVDSKAWREMMNAAPAVISRVGRESSRPQVPAAEVHETTLGPVLAGAVDLAAVRTAGTGVAKVLPGVTVAMDIRESREEMSAPNTIGILEGTDPTLRNEYVVFSAHMDHIGIRSAPGQADSINNGADDDASGTVGVIELAEAFSRPGARPKRSLLFITVSGEEKGLWGSSWFSEHPTVPLGQIVANINLDMIGRNWTDTIVAIGKEHSDLGATLNRVNATHPELRMTAIDDKWPEERFYFRSDHYNFARKGIPILFFFNGVHEDYHRVSDSPDKIDAEKESRIVKLLFYLGQDVANATARPKWNPESYKTIVEGPGR